MNLFKELLEVDSSPVDVDWFYKKAGEWFGSFKVNEVEYDISFTREDLKHNIENKVVSLKFSRPDLNDPYAFSKDFNKPLVVKNTILKELKEYILKEKIEVFVIKSFTKEQSRVKKYRLISHGLVRDFGFIFEDEITHGEYTYFVLLRNKEVYIDRNKILSTIK